MKKFLKRLLIVMVIVAALTSWVALDLASHGLAWRFAWSVTGEEEPQGQIAGVLQWAMGLTRPQPRTAPLTPIQHLGEQPFGINTFFGLEVEQPKIEAQMQMIADAGFTWVRQQFPWEDLEIDGRGQYTDSRNDTNGDGVPDTIDAFLKYDRIVDLAERYGLRIQARLDNPPDWSRSNPDAGAFAPPDDLQDFVNYAVTVAQRYQGRIHYYQIWNEPNIFPEWGNQPVDPVRYTELLCRTYDALKAVDPEIVVISGALAPTIALTGRDLSDVIFLQRMYDSGAGACFDVLSIQGYGLNSGPTDRRMRPTTINVARNLYIRDLMVANGDEHKPIWISEAAWNFVPTEAEEPNIDGFRQMFGQVTPQQAADYIPQLYQRAQEEWPWVGVINYWFFTRPDDSERSQPKFYFRMVEPDYSPERPTFTPLPVYHAMRDYILGLTPTLYRGTHQVDGHWAISAPPAEAIGDSTAQLGQALLTSRLSFTAHGTGVWLRWRDGTIQVSVDGQPARTYSAGSEWQAIQLSAARLPQEHVIVIAAEADFIADSILVTDRTFENIFPLAAVTLISAVMLIIAVGAGLWRRS